MKISIIIPLHVHYEILRCDFISFQVFFFLNCVYFFIILIFRGKKGSLLAKPAVSNFSVIYMDSVSMNLKKVENSESSLSLSLSGIIFFILPFVWLFCVLFTWYTNLNNSFKLVNLIVWLIWHYLFWYYIVYTLSMYFSCCVFI